MQDHDHLTVQMCVLADMTEASSRWLGRCKGFGHWLTCIEALAGELIPKGCIQLDLLAISAYEGVLLRVEGEVASNGEGCHQLWGGDEGVCGWVAVVTSSKVAVV